MSFQGKEVLFSERCTTFPSSEAQALETLPKSVWPRAQGSLITGPKVTSTSVPSLPHHTQRMMQGGRNGWGLNHIRLQRTAPPKQLAQPDWVPITAPQLALIRVGLGIRPGPGDFLDRCHTPGRCPLREAVQTSLTPMLGALAQGPQDFLNRLHLPFFLCREEQTMSPSPVS